MTVVCKGASAHEDRAFERAPYFHPGAPLGLTTYPSRPVGRGWGPRSSLHPVQKPPLPNLVGPEAWGVRMSNPSGLRCWGGEGGLRKAGSTVITKAPLQRGFVLMLQNALDGCPELDFAFQLSPSSNSFNSSHYPASIRC